MVPSSFLPPQCLGEVFPHLGGAAEMAPVATDHRGVTPLETLAVDEVLHNVGRGTDLQCAEDPTSVAQWLGHKLLETSVDHELVHVA